jgi:hypothetical protein
LALEPRLILDAKTPGGYRLEPGFLDRPAAGFADAMRARVEHPEGVVDVV